MNQPAWPLIVGAGPVGLSAALFLAERGIRTRLIEQAEEPSGHSKALAVNPRTLELLESSGVTGKMLALGLRIRGVRICQEDGPASEVTFEGLEHKYPFMLALSQATSERLLAEALGGLGGKIERGTSLVTCRNGLEGVYVELRHLPENRRETLRCPCLLAADGAHSTVRRQVDVKFKGSSFERSWHLVDVALETSLESDLAHVFFAAEGFTFLIRVINDIAQDAAGPPVWRAVSNLPDPLGKIPAVRPMGPPLWSSAFHVSHGINETLQAGNVCFAGDSAHLHSPMGARGMNLGIEDAWVFSQLVHTDEFGAYGPLRKTVDQRVVTRIEWLSRMVRGESAPARRVRSIVTRKLVKLPFVQHKMFTTMMGLDHPLDAPQHAAVMSGQSQEKTANQFRKKASHQV